MSNTHDFVIANDTGAAVRADLNVCLSEVQNSGTGDSAPSTAVAGKLWHDTTTDTLKYYTGTDWVSVARATKSAANNTDITGTIDPAASTSVTGVSTVFTTEAKIGDKLVVTGETRTITAIASNTACTVDVAFSNNSNDATPEIHPAAFVVTDDSNGIDLLVDTDGKVGVNCATPGAQVDVRGPTGTGKIGEVLTAEITVEDADQLGRIEFIAPLEASGTDAILVGASIYAEADATFAADNNATDLVFATGASEAATERMRITSAGGIVQNGFTDGSSAGAGKIGEVLTAETAGTSLTTSPQNMLSLSLTAGDWDVSALHAYSGTTAQFYSVGINTVSATLGTLGTDYTYFTIYGVGGQGGGSINPRRFTLSSTTTVYLVAKVNTGSYPSFRGLLNARRVR